MSLATPNMFAALGPYAFFIFAVFNLFAVGIVFCFYPETSCRTLEEIDFLFASKSPFVWETEKRFRELKAEHGWQGGDGGVGEKAAAEEMEA